MIDKKIGILGGGQLGKMLCQAGTTMGMNISILDKDDTFPAAKVTDQFFHGDFNSMDDVLRFGQNMDIITVEIESVNADALEVLELRGKKVFPQSRVLKLIKDKGLQKNFYQEHNFPTSTFDLYDSAEDLRKAVKEGYRAIPFVQKSRTDGYDGQGVLVVKSEKDLEKLIDAPCVAEDLVDIDKEIAVIVARNESGEVSTFPLAEMEFHPTANLVEFLFSPSALPEGIHDQARALATEIAEKLEIVGLLAVELFLSKSGAVLVNEVAPRPHNSGHHTIEANITSQYQQHLRAICNLPLGDTATIIPAVMVNILGDKDHTGPALYQDLDKCLEKSGVHMHIYGKVMTKPFRKMGHVTIIDNSLDAAKAKARFVKDTLRVISK